MSLARNTSKTVPPDKRRRVGGPLQPNQADSPNPDFEDVGSGSDSEELAEDDRDPEPAPSSSAATRQGPSTRSSVRSAAASIGVQSSMGKEEAGPPAKRRGKTQKANRGPAQDPDEQDELLLRERSMEAMEQRLLNAVRGVVRKEQQEQALSSAAPVPSSVTKALYGIPALKEKEFEVWL